MRSDERQLLRETLRRIFVEAEPSKLPIALEEFGFAGLLETELQEAVRALFEVQGETVSASGMLNTVMARALVPGERDDDTRGSLTVVVPGPGRGSDVVGHQARDRLSVDGFALSVPHRPVERCVAVLERSGQRVVAAFAADDTDIHQVDGLDPSIGLVRVRAALAPAIVFDADGDAAWTDAVASGRRAFAHELLGASRAVLALGVDHARSRAQFGRAIGSFQAVKHRLAEAKVMLAAAELAVAEAWTGDTPEDFSALLAKLWAGRAARIVARNVQQVLGGMGFTWEHPFHRFFRRVLVLDSLLGSSVDLEFSLGRTILESDQLPEAVTL